MTESFDIPCNYPWWITRLSVCLYRRKLEMAADLRDSQNTDIHEACVLTLFFTRYSSTALLSGMQAVNAMAHSLPACVPCLPRTLRVTYQSRVT